MDKFKADFSIDRENRTITIKREFAAPVPLVWDAYTKSELLDQWWGPKPWNARTKSMDFREGGRRLYSMLGPEGQEHWGFSDYTKIVPQERFVSTAGFSDAEGNVNTAIPPSQWDVSFAAKGEHTVVTSTITYQNVETLETILQMGFKEGYSQGMDQLDELLPSLKK